jgi:ketosteroid isomerase-like protein
LLGGGGRGVAESSFHGTRRKDGLAINAVGVEMFEFRDGRIAEIRDYHRLLR